MVCVVFAWDRHDFSSIANLVRMQLANLGPDLRVIRKERWRTRCFCQCYSFKTQFARSRIKTRIVWNGTRKRKWEPGRRKEKRKRRMRLVMRRTDADYLKTGRQVGISHSC